MPVIDFTRINGPRWVIHRPDHEGQAQNADVTLWTEDYPSNNIDKIQIKDAMVTIFTKDGYEYHICADPGAYVWATAWNPPKTKELNHHKIYYIGVENPK